MEFIRGAALELVNQLMNDSNESGEDINLDDLDGSLTNLVQDKFDTFVSNPRVGLYPWVASAIDTVVSKYRGKYCG